MKTYSQFILNEKHTELKYSIFDWDDNILHMPTKIYFIHNGEKVGVSTDEYIRLKETNWGNGEYEFFDGSFDEFRDFGPRGDRAFLLDTIIAIKNRDFGPSWYDFINTLVSGELFGIVTTRGHEPNSIRMTVEWIIFNYLNDDQQDKMIKNLIIYKKEFREETDFDFLVSEYLNHCFFIGIMSDYAANLFGEDIKNNIAVGKKKAVKYIMDKFAEYGNKIQSKVKIGFSDDDKQFYNIVKKLFIRNKDLYNDVNFYAFDTSGRKKNKTII
jgi:hypothetical protein